MGNKCSECNIKIGIGKQKLPFEDKQSNSMILCTECYKKMPKERKKKLIYIGKENFKFNPIGLAFGIIGGMAFNEGANSAEKTIVDYKKNKYDFTDEELDSLSIDMYDMHFWGYKDEKKLCDNCQFGNDLK